MPIGSVGVGRLIAHLVLDSTQFTAGLGQAQSALARAGAGMQRVGRAMTTFVTLPLVAAGAAGIKLSMDFESAFGRMEGLAGVPRKELEGLKEATLDIAEEMGRLPQEVGDALFFVASSGFEAAEALDVVEISAKAARGGMGDTMVVADLLTAVISAYGKENITAAEAADTLTAAIRLGKAEPDLLAHSLGRVIPIAAQMGVDFNQVGAAVAAMSRKMSASNVSVAVVNLRQMLSDLLSPAKHSRDALEAWGLSAQKLRDTIREKGLLEALALINARMTDNDEAFSQIFGNVRSLTGALELAGISSQDVAEIFEDMKDNTNELDRAMAAAANTVRDRWNRALASAARAGIELGDALMPLFEDLIAAVRSAAQWFSSLDEASKRLAVGIGLSFAAAGPAMVALGSLVTILAAISLKVVLVLAAVAALAASFIFLSKNWDAVKERISDWDWWKDMLDDMRDYLEKNNPIGLLADLIEEGIRNLKDQETAGERLERIIEKMKQDAQFDAIIEKAEETEEGLDIDPDPSGIKEYEHEFISMKDILVEGYDAMLNAMEKFFNKAKIFTKERPTVPEVPLPPGVPEAIGGAPPTTGAVGARAPLGEIPDDIKKAKEAVDELSDAFEITLVNAISSFAETLGNVLSGDAGVEGLFDSIMLVIADFMVQFGKALIAVGVASEAFKNAFKNPLVAIAAGVALVAAGTAAKGIIKKSGMFSGDVTGKGFRGSGGVQGLASGGFVVQGGVFQLHKNELVNLPTGSAVTPAGMAGGGQLDVNVFGRISGYDIAINQRKERYFRSRTG